MKKVFRIAAIAIGAALFASTSGYCAANNSNTATVTLTATLGESLTVSATPSNVTFSLVAGSTANGSAPVAIQTAWVLNGARASVTLTGWFSSASQAMAGTGSTPQYITTSSIYGQLNSTTGTYTAFTQSPGTGAPGVAGASLVLYTQAITNSNRTNTRNDNLNLQINLTGQPQLAADTYTGTLNLQAQAL
jgi:hypothetical protein